MRLYLFPMPHRSTPTWRGVPFAVTLLALGMVVLCLQPASAATKQTWQSALTRHTVIMYEDDAALMRFYRALQLSPELKRAYAHLPPVGAEQDTPLARKVDFLFVQVQDMLDMHGPMPRVVIRLHTAPLHIETHAPGARCGPITNPKAWYVTETKNIYVSLATVSTAILTHEMAHHVTNSHFGTRPACMAGELLATYIANRFGTPLPQGHAVTGKRAGRLSGFSNYASPPPHPHAHEAVAPRLADARPLDRGDSRIK